MARVQVSDLTELLTLKDVDFFHIKDGSDGVDKKFSYGNLLIPISKGGTGSTTAAGARDNLGLGDLATKNETDLVSDLNLGTSAERDVVTSPTNTTGGRVLVVGADEVQFSSNTQTTIKAARRSGVGSYVDLRGTEYNIGYPEDLFATGFVTGIGTGTDLGLSSINGVLTSKNVWTDITANTAMIREFQTGYTEYFQYALDNTTWSEFAIKWNSKNQLALGTTAATARAALDLGTSASTNTTTSSTDTTTGRVLTVGADKSQFSTITEDQIGYAFNAGVWSKNSSSSPKDSMVYGDKGLVTFQAPFGKGTSEGWPSTSNWWSGIRFTSNYPEYQPALLFNLSDMYLANIEADGSGATNPRKIYHTSNIISPVSQSSGVPTGGIIERGSNANGEYTKFADGTLICTGEVDNGTSTDDITWVFPSTYINTNINVQTTNVVTSSSVSGKAARVGSVSTLTTSSVLIVPRDSATVASAEFRIQAIGRWY